MRSGRVTSAKGDTQRSPPVTVRDSCPTSPRAARTPGNFHGTYCRYNSLHRVRGAWPAPLGCPIFHSGRLSVLRRRLKRFILAAGRTNVFRKEHGAQQESTIDKEGVRGHGRASAARDQPRPGHFLGPLPGLHSPCPEVAQICGPRRGPQCEAGTPATIVARL